MEEDCANIHMSTDGTKSALAWLTAGTSAVVCLGFAQTAGGRYRRPPSKKPKATDFTTAVDHGNHVLTLKAPLVILTVSQCTACTVSNKNHLTLYYITGL